MKYASTVLLGLLLTVVGVAFLQSVGDQELSTPGILVVALLSLLVAQIVVGLSTRIYHRHFRSPTNAS
jgi:hypothetical protein